MVADTEIPDGTDFFVPVPLTPTFFVSAPVLVIDTFPDFAPALVGLKRTSIVVLETVPPVCVKLSELP